MMFKYYYIDDNSIEKSEGILKGLVSSELEIIVTNPKHWGEKMQEIESDVPDGILLDWRLDLEQANKADYTSEALAQQIRRLATEGKLPEFPIILCSADRDFKIIYAKDLTGHDLFDKVYEKDDFSKEQTSIQKCLISLANGYKVLREQSDISLPQLLGIETSLIEKLDIRFKYELEQYKKLSTHDLAKFLVKEVLETPGILINEKFVAARLGVDLSMDENQSSWQIFKEKFLCEYKYKGIFSDGWDCWWAELIEEFGYSVMEKPLQAYDAGQRLNKLKEKCGIEFSISKPLKYSDNFNFWTLCVGTEKPLDPSEGFLTNKHQNYPWQDCEYVSLYAILERIGINKLWTLNILEKNRLAHIKQTLEDE